MKKIAATIISTILIAFTSGADKTVVIESDARESNGLFHQVTAEISLAGPATAILQYVLDTNMNLQLPYLSDISVTNSWIWTYPGESRSLTITDPASITNVVWESFNLQVNVQTNIVTEWATVREDNCIIPEALSIHCTDALYQVGFLITNRVLRVITEKKTNEVILKQLGRDTWPSQQRIEQIPARYRP